MVESPLRLLDYRLNLTFIIRRLQLGRLTVFCTHSITTPPNQRLQTSPKAYGQLLTLGKSRGSLGGIQLIKELPAVLQFVRVEVPPDHNKGRDTLSGCLGPIHRRTDRV